MEEKKKKKKTKIKPETVVFSGLVLVASYLILIAILACVFNIDNKLTRKTAAIIPYPAAFVNNSTVNWNELKKRTDSVRKFYESQNFSDLGLRVDFSTIDGQKRLKIKEKDILSKMIEDKVIEQEATKRGIFITREMVSQEISRKMEELGSADYLKKNLSRLYGWTIEDFEENIVKPDLYKEKLLEYLRQNEASFSEAKIKMEKVKKELESKKSFEEVAAKYSEGESAKNGGDVGWFSASEMLPEISKVAFELERGSQSEIIESSIGYHILKLEEKKNQDGKDMVHLRQIFIRTLTLSDWLENREKEARIYIPNRSLLWNKERAMIDFKNQELKSFEENLEKNSQNDVSVMF